MLITCPSCKLFISFKNPSLVFGHSDELSQKTLLTSSASASTSTSIKLSCPYFQLIRPPSHPATHPATRTISLNTTQETLFCLKHSVNLAKHPETSILMTSILISLILMTTILMTTILMNLILMTSILMTSILLASILMTSIMMTSILMTLI